MRPVGTRCDILSQTNPPLLTAYITLLRKIRPVPIGHFQFHFCSPYHIYVPVRPLNPVYTLLIFVRISSVFLTCTYLLFEVLNLVSIFHHLRILSEESVVDRGNCSSLAKPTNPCLRPVNDVFLGGACGAYGRWERCAQGSGRET
jgi:hypothetical protein